MPIKVGIDGVGRIGCNGLSCPMQDFGNALQIVASNDLPEPDCLACLLRYDSVRGRFKREAKVDRQMRGARSAVR
jgi:glyceraldehyde 3-phosphate dehydrogenase